MASSNYVAVSELITSLLGINARSVPNRSATSSPITAQQNYDGLTQLISIASASADNYCNQNSPLYATQSTEQDTVDAFKCGVNNDGWLWFHAANRPIISISEFKYGYIQTGGITWNQAAVSDLIADDSMVYYPGQFYRRDYRMRVSMTYLNGWPNTYITGSSTIAANSTSIPLEDLTGFTPGQVVTIYDLGNTEDITVASNFSPITGAGNLTLESGTKFAHAPIARPAPANSQPYDVRVSAMPSDIKQAVLLICKFYIEERGSDALVMRSTGGVNPIQARQLQQEDLPIEAKLLLEKYVVRF